MEKEEEMSKTVQDPRPELEEDSIIWYTLLLLAFLEHKGHEIYETLRGFRCAGCRLKIGNEKEGLIFNFPEDATEGEKDLIKKYALLYKSYIKDVFNRVWRGFVLKEIEIDQAKYVIDKRTKKWVKR